MAQTDLPDGQISLCDLSRFRSLAWLQIVPDRVRGKTDFTRQFNSIGAVSSDPVKISLSENPSTPDRRDFTGPARRRPQEGARHE